MKTFNEVRQLHIEISSMCNARCPGCPRNFYGYPVNRGFEETNLTIEKFKSMISSDILTQVEQIWFNGNYGDFIMNDDGPEIVEYILSINPSVDINISTNGSARNKSYWTRLGQSGVKVWFCLDGLADTHSIYRQDTNFERILTNAKNFQSSGGNAIWQYTIFEHNSHQIDEAKQLSKKLNFTDFVTRPNNRPPSPVYNRKGEKIFTLGNITPSQYPDKITKEYLEGINHNNKFSNNSKIVEISCESIGLLSAYIGSTGTVSPCCYLGLPHKKDSWTILENDKIEKDTLYFSLVQEGWKSTPHGVCKKHCGKQIT